MERVIQGGGDGSKGWGPCTDVWEPQDQFLALYCASCTTGYSPKTKKEKKMTTDGLRRQSCHKTSIVRKQPTFPLNSNEQVVPDFG